MKIFCIATRADKPAEEFAPHLEAESKKAFTFMKDDFCREIYGRRDGKGAVLVLEADSEDSARARLAELPLAEAGLLNFDLYPVGAYRAIVAMADA